jgi:hypothetical protein
MKEMPDYVPVPQGQYVPPTSQSTNYSQPMQPGNVPQIGAQPHPFFMVSNMYLFQILCPNELIVLEF